MNKGKYISVTIAVPAHNEESSLRQMLKSISDIKLTDKFELTKIILVSDGSTDKTPEIIKQYGHPKGKPVDKIIDKVRKGKIYRLNQIFSLSKTKYLVILDADIMLYPKAVENLLLSATHHKSVLTVSHQIAIKPRSFIGKVIYRGYKMWEEIRTASNVNLDNYQNFYGAASVYDYKFYHRLRIPYEFHDEREYIYFAAKTVGKFVYEKSSIIYYHPVSTYRDFYVMGGRSEGIESKIQKMFGDSIRKSNDIPFIIKSSIALKHLLLNPIETTLFLILKYWVALSKKNDPLVSKGMWTMAKSTKIGFNKKQYD